MFNYRVENMVELLKVLKEEGVQIVGEIEEYPYGKFGWIMDPDGNKIELWEPKEEGFEPLISSLRCSPNRNFMAKPLVCAIRPFEISAYVLHRVFFHIRVGSAILHGLQ